MAQEGNPVLDAVDRVLKDFADPQIIIKATTDEWNGALWKALEELGLPGLWTREELGGLAMSLGEGLNVCALLGRHAIAVPIAEAMIANWVLGAANIQAPSGAVVTALLWPVPQAGKADGGVWRSEPTLFALQAKHIVLVAGGSEGARVAVVPHERVDVQPVESVAGEGRAVVSVRDAGKLEWEAVPQLEPTHVLLLGATVRSLQIAGALEAMLGMTLEYAQQRVAFGKTISKFQAVQQRMAQLGGEVAAAIAVSQSAAEALASATDYADAAVWLEVASAKIRCGEAAEAACAIAHQVHGAIGFAAEHPLHRFTLRALGWRDDFGDEVFWAKRLGKLVTSDRQAPLWHFLASR